MPVDGKMLFVDGAKNRTGGFSLLEITLTLIILGILYAATMSILPWMAQDVQLQKSRVLMEDVQRSITAFALTNHRLPCPDTTNTGVENCAANAVLGGVPFETLLLDGSVFDTSQQNIIYGIYRNGAALADGSIPPAVTTVNPTAGGADLGLLVNRINRLNEVDGSLNKYDFCQALRNGAAAGLNINFVSSSADTATPWATCGAGTFQNHAYILASSGYEDTDGANGFFDGQNNAALANLAAAPFCFESPQRGRDAVYDDIVIGVGFTTLLGEVCA